MSDEIVADLLLVEGWPAYTDDPTDKGGPTKGGITLQTLRDWRYPQPVTTDDLRELPQAEAEAIYRRKYIEGPGFDAIGDPLLRWQVVDCGVPSGPRRAVEWLQFALGVKVDGVLGPVTLSAVNAADPHVIGLRLACARIRFMGRVIERDHDQAKYAAGWLTRATRFIEREATRSG